jgi:PAS domain S-box-containing protein
MSSVSADGAGSGDALSRLLIENIDDYAVFALDREGRVLSWCNPAERLLGYAEQDVLGQRFEQFYTSEDIASGVPEQELQQALSAGRLKESRWYLRKDGSRFWSNGLTKTLCGSDGVPFGFAKVMQDCSDCTAVRRAEQALERQQKQLRQLASELSHAEQRERRRLAQILHDHLQQLIVAARIQVASLTRDMPRERRLATSVAVQRLDDILDEALAASRSLAVELSPPVLEQAGLLGAFRWLVSRMQMQHAFSVHLHADPTAQLEPETEAIRCLLFECARELLLNAVKHASVDAAELTLMRSSDTELKLIVSDSGKGFDPEAIKQRRIDEIGFGLLNIQERLAYFGGRLEIKSAPEQGTQATLTIASAKASPVPDTKLAEGAKVKAATLAIRDKATTCRVLIVDDHPVMREGLVSLLEFVGGIEVAGQVADGAEAIAAAERLTPDVVLMDVSLGAMDGIEATERVLAAQPQIKVIGLSMHVDEAVADAMRAAGAFAYLTKGGQPEALIEAIQAGCGA